MPVVFDAHHIGCYFQLLTIMGEFTPEQQRAFCQFVTGAPRLPPGGLAVLNPKLTIVRKVYRHVSDNSDIYVTAYALLNFVLCIIIFSIFFFAYHYPR